MEHEIEKKIRDLKGFIKQKTDQGTANYLGKELRELCGMVETEALRIHDVVGRSEQLIAKEQDAFDKGYTKGWTEGFNSGRVNGD